jgi:probable F420-dependent oxidoreductase
MMKEPMRAETLLPIGKVDPGLRDVSMRIDLARVPEMAREAEAIGYDGIASGETKNDPFLPLALAATTTSRVRLTTAVTIAFPRSPTAVAMTAWDLQALSKGRFVLGLGPQVKGHIERRYGTPWAPPMPRLREYIQAVRAVWNSWQHHVPLDFTGTYYNLSLMVPLFDPGPIEHPDIPIQIAAVNAGMCRLAGELCQGMRPHPICTPKYIAEVMLPAAQAGAHKAGRDLTGFDVIPSPLIATAPSVAELGERTRDVRARIAFYASTRTYRAVFEHHGWGELVDELHQYSVQKRWEEMPARISDEVLDTIAIVGTHDQIAGKLKERYGPIATGLEFGIPLRRPGDREALADTIRALHR